MRDLDASVDITKALVKRMQPKVAFGTVDFLNG